MNTSGNEGLRLMFVGDISLGEHFFSFGHGPRTLLEEGRNPMEDCKELFAKAHLVIGNLEGPISDFDYKPSSALSRVFRGGNHSAKALSHVGVNVVSVANNHSLQHGLECFWESIKNLEAAKVVVIGKSRAIERWTILTVLGKRIGLIAASDIKDQNYVPHNSYRMLDVNELILDITALKIECDIVILALHWGLESDILPDASLKEMGHQFSIAGADIIVGHHPHIFYPIFANNSNVIAHSLGNFVFDLPWSEQLRRSAILDISFNAMDKLASVSLWPVYISRRGSPTLVGEEVRAPLTEVSNLANPLDLFHFQSLDSFIWLRKIIYFVIMLPLGATHVKIDFLLWKIKCKLRR